MPYSVSRKSYSLYLSGTVTHVIREAWRYLSFFINLRKVHLRIRYLILSKAFPNFNLVLPYNIC